MTKSTGIKKARAITVRALYISSFVIIFKLLFYFISQDHQTVAEMYILYDGVVRQLQIHR